MVLLACYDATLTERYSKELILRKLKKHSKKRKIDKCNYLGLLDLNTVEVSLSSGVFLDLILYIFYPK